MPTFLTPVPDIAPDPEYVPSIPAMPLFRSQPNFYRGDDDDALAEGDYGDPDDAA